MNTSVWEETANLARRDYSPLVTDNHALLMEPSIAMVSQLVQVKSGVWPLELGV
jgi:hypothetical protein